MRRHVVIAGGGVAALECLLALRALAAHRVRITLLSPEREFVYRPVTVAEAFGRGEARTFSLDQIAANQDSELIWDTLEAVDGAKTVITGTGDRLTYDVLVIATGARSVEPLPGALTFRGRDDVPELRGLLGDLVEGSARSVTFAVPTVRAWPLPLYELALMTAAHLQEHGARATVTLVTPEASPLELFGEEASTAVGDLLDAHGITLRSSSVPAAIRGRALVLAGGAQVFSDRVVTLGVPDGIRIPGLPQDAHGFIRVDGHGRLPGYPDVYAAGDVTAFSLKQGGLAAQQADAVANAIAAELGVPVQARPLRPVLRGLLITGGAPLYLRSEPQNLPWAHTVASEALRTGLARPGASWAAGQPLWWPPAKIAGRYLGPYLATAHPVPVAAAVLADRAPIPGPPVETEVDEALELTLLIAELDARWGDYRSALEALASAQALAGALPPEYEEKRRQWERANRLGS